MKQTVNKKSKIYRIKRTTIQNLINKDRLNTNMIKGGDGAGVAVSLGNPCTVMTKP